MNKSSVSPVSMNVLHSEDSQLCVGEFELCKTILFKIILEIEGFCKYFIVGVTKLFFSNRLKLIPKTP